MNTPNPAKLILLTYDDEYFTTPLMERHRASRVIKSLQTGGLRFVPVMEGGFISAENIKRIWVGNE